MNESANTGILSGVRVVELSLYLALPLTGRMLAALGAEVIKVESNTAFDQTWLSATPGLLQAEHRLLKRNISLNLREPKAMPIIQDLIKKSDIFMTNLGAQAMTRFGVEIARLRDLKDDLIILWQTGLGSSGPYAGLKGYGLLMQHVCGISLMNGSPERPGVASVSYSDYHTYLFNVLALLGALDKRRRTGRGTIIECPIYDSGVWTVGPALLNYQVSGVIPERIENRDNCAAPHGAYPCKGEDRWCVIAVFTDTEWKSFCEVLGNPPWTSRGEFRTLTDRLRNVAELDMLVSEWTVNHSATEVMEQMHKAGVPAGIVSKGEDLANCEHLKSREFYREAKFYSPEIGKLGIDWPEMGPAVMFTEPIRFSETPCLFGPMSRIGQDNGYVYGEILEMPEERIKQLTDEGVLI
ncbi:MAG: CoA transferase [Dehalococcoidia bacterium]|nr:CoA transferase [Dehalococcoidia bacterium]